MKNIIDIAAGSLVVLFLVVPSIVCWLKGKKLWATLGFFTGWHWIPVFRLALPDSWWATRYYDETKLARARKRFPEGDPYAGPPVQTDVFDLFTDDEIAEQDAITRRAWAKARDERKRTLTRASRG